jgi:hypothetical protein
MFSRKGCPLTISVRITGGLGNQLFKLFHGVHLSNLFQTNLEIDTTWYLDSRDRRKLVASREFDIDFFPEIARVATKTWRSPGQQRVFGQIMRRAPFNVQNRVGYMTDSNRQLFIDDKRRPRFVDGSFESLEFLSDSKTITTFLQYDGSTEWLTPRIKDVRTNNPLAIHVRRGDFLNLPDMYDVVSRDYYSKALQMAREKNGVQPIHLFSDDPTSAIAFLGSDFPVDKIISQELGVKTAEVFHLLSHYPTLIGANSTFSWWAGFVSHLKEISNFCTMPQKFLGPGHDDPANRLRHPGVTVIPS